MKDGEEEEEDDDINVLREQVSAMHACSPLSCELQVASMHSPTS